ncbi:MAG: hypothetical protein AB7U82_33655 [Blastocatellales bacterium]
MKQTVWQKIATWLVSLRRVGGLELPDEGRSSVEGTLGDRIGAALDAFGTVSPVIDFQMLAVLKRLWLFNPDFSQYVNNIVNLANTGHDIIVDAASTERAEAVLTRLNESASRLYPLSAGIDGLVNDYLAQIAWSGALSSEDVVNFPAKRVEQVVIVPVEQIRFRYLDGRYVPHQQPTMLIGFNRSTLGLIPLNENTYRYYAIQHVENSPYAKPPATAAVDQICGPQKDIFDNIGFIAKKLGILGLVSVSVTQPPRKPNETEAEYQARAKNYLTGVKDALAANFNKGLLVTYRDQKIEHANVASNASGAYDIVRTTEEQVFSGMGTFPAFHGRTDSTTETYADVVYNLLLAQAGNMQRLVKRRLEATYRLDLRLAGIEVAGVAIQFNRAHARDPLKEAQAEQARVQTAIEKVKAGIIGPDDAAQELGYESAFDPELFAALPDVATALQTARSRAGLSGAQATFRFDRGSQRYRYVSARIESTAAVESDYDNVVPLKKKYPLARVK